jgi:hypothetical protein
LQNFRILCDLFCLDCLEEDFFAFFFIETDIVQNRVRLDPSLFVWMRIPEHKTAKLKTLLLQAIEWLLPA